MKNPNPPFRGSREELASLITMVQEHPLSPPALKDNITDALVQAQDQLDFTETPEAIAVCLASHERAADRQYKRIHPND